MAVFVSYSSVDARHLASLVSALRLGRIEYWYDDELRVGSEWWGEILRQIRRCDVLVVAVSQNWVESAACRMELDYARNLHKSILAVRIGGDDRTGQAELEGLRIVDFRSPDSGAGVELITAVRTAEAAVGPPPDPLPPEPDVPFAYLQRAHALITAPQITAQNQSEALAELRTALGNEGTHRNARGEIVGLLARLRDHPDVTRRVRQEILELPGLPSPPELRKRRRRTGSAAAAVILLVAAAGVALMLWKPWRDDRPEVALVAASQLGQLLLTEDDANRIMVTANMRTSDVKDDLSVSASGSGAPCSDALWPAVEAAYRDSGWDSVLTQVISSTNPDNSIDQSVVGFHNVDEAVRFLDAAEDRWAACASKAGAYTEDGSQTSVRIEPATRTGPLLTLYYQREGAGDASSCQHALTVVANVALEAVACGQRIDGEGAQAVDEMAAKLNSLRD